MATLLLLFALIKSDFPFALPLRITFKLLFFALSSVRVISPSSEIVRAIFEESEVPSAVMAV